MNYSAISSAIKTILDEIEGAYVFIETPNDSYTTSGPEVGIFLDREENDERTIGVDEYYHTILRYEIVCQEFSPDGVEDACSKRDALVGKVRDALKSDRTLGGTVGVTQIGNIVFETARGEAGFYSAASLELKAQLFS